jgi:hypothetical protein
MTDAPDYYDMHISVQKIMKGDKVPMESVQFLKAEDGPLWHGFNAKDPGWKYIIRDNGDEVPPPIIKIIGHERNEISKWNGEIHENSVYKKFMS